MRLFFADTSPADPENVHEIEMYGGKRHYFRGPWLWTFIEQIINSAIVGTIVFVSTLGPGEELQWIPAIKGFGITMAIELRKYRQLPTR